MLMEEHEPRMEYMLRGYIFDNVKLSVRVV